MNTIIKILTFLIILVNICSAQNFFPLKVGNVYQVKDDWWWAGPGNTGGSGTNYFNLKVVSDTVINGETFFTLSSNIGNNPFSREHLFRYDSLQQKLFIRIPNNPRTRLAADFNAPNDSIYVSYINETGENYISRGISYLVVLGDTHAVYSMEDPVIPRHYYKFSDKIGFIYYEYYFGWYSGASSSTQNVISAMIDSVIFNRLTLSVDTLYPIFDRPVDTFPYLLTIPYTASYSALVDSFYLTVHQIREDTLVQSKQFNISKSNPKISFYLSGLASGDKLKLRATITDTSIFYNTDNYPDTGWVVMNVLPPILNVVNENPLADYGLKQNFPNPFNHTTTIRYQIPEPAFVTVKVYDVLGNEIRTLVKDEKIAGSYDIAFDSSELTSGIYYYRITAGNFSQTKKMILLK